MTIYSSRLYQYFFCFLSLYICAAPVFVLEDPRDKWQMSHYTLVQNACWVLTVDPILVLIFIGPRKLISSFYTLEIFTSIALVGLSIVSDFMSPEKGQSLAQTHYNFFLLYSFICFAKINRIFNTVLQELPQIKAVFGVMRNLKPFLKDMIGMIICMFLLYGQIGVQYYGGMINSSTPEKFKEILGENLPVDYHKINFNDFPNAMVSLYNLLLNNNWLTVANMYLINTDSSLFRYYFISFIMMVNLLIMNLIIGFIVEVILFHLNKKYAKNVRITDIVDDHVKKLQDEFDDSSEEDAEEEDVYVDDEKETDLEEKARMLAEAFNKGLEKNLKYIGQEEEGKKSSKEEQQIEMMPMV